MDLANELRHPEGNAADREVSVGGGAQLAEVVGLTQVEGHQHPAVEAVGHQVGGDVRVPVVEAHLLEFEGDLYGKEIRLTFIERLRDERRFAGPEALLEQIQRDILRARLILNSHREGSDA